MLGKKSILHAVKPLSEAYDELPFCVWGHRRGSSKIVQLFVYQYPKLSSVKFYTSVTHYGTPYAPDPCTFLDPSSFRLVSAWTRGCVRSCSNSVSIFSYSKMLRERRKFKTKPYIKLQSSYTATPLPPSLPRATSFRLLRDLFRQT